MPRPAAFFDLDGTLLRVNSGTLWLIREIRHRRVTAVQVARAVGYLAAYNLGFVDIVAATRMALQSIRGVPEDDVRAWTLAWFHREVVRHAAPGAWAVLRHHRHEGRPLVLLSSTSPYEAAAAADWFGLDDRLSTRYEVRDGRFTGELVLPPCFGEGKIAAAETWAAGHDVDVRRSWFYTDSFTDLPMLEWVAHPCAVAPDFRLRRIARRRGWPVLDWSRPGNEP
jgi:HAD superfamily hydrolase (TIGR01490 family)